MHELLIEQNNLSEEILVTSFYHFFDVENSLSLQRKLLKFCKDHFIKGTLLIANEGINATMAGSRENIYKLYEIIENLTNITNITYQEMTTKSSPFEKLKIKIKPEIVTMGVEDIDVKSNRGTYIEPKDWDNFINNDDVILVDTRNKYETNLGSFENSIDPQTTNFRDFPEWSKQNLELFKNKKVAMFCTGGIRCEKSTSFLKKIGVDNVYHLKGGIINYLKNKRETKNDNNKWWGKCFIFDNRASLNKELVTDPVYCNNCKEFISTRELKHVKSENDILCLNCS